MIDPRPAPRPAARPGGPATSTQEINVTERYSTASLAEGTDPTDPTPTVIDLDGLYLTEINGQTLPPEWLVEQARIVNEPEIPCQNLELTVWVGNRGASARQMVTIQVTVAPNQWVQVTDGPGQTAPIKPTRRPRRPRG